MEKEFLESLGLEQDAVTAILAEQEKIETQHAEAMAALRLEHAVEAAVQRAGGRSVPAIRALLDMEDIATAQDLPKALDTALAQLKKDSAYLFEGETPPPYARFTGSADRGGAEAPQTLAGALRQRMGRH